MWETWDRLSVVSTSSASMTADTTWPPVKASSTAIMTTVSNTMIKTIR